MMFWVHGGGRFDFDKFQYAISTGAISSAFPTAGCEYFNSFAFSNKGERFAALFVIENSFKKFN